MLEVEKLDNDAFIAIVGPRPFDESTKLPTPALEQEKAEKKIAGAEPRLHRSTPPRPKPRTAEDAAPVLKDSEE